jgi:hypothetical protein
LLGGVPAAVADFVGGPWIELDEDVVVFAAFEDVEAATEEFGGIEVFGFGKFFGDELGSGEAVECEGAEVAFGGVPGEEVPEVVDAGEVVGVDEARLGTLGVNERDPSPLIPLPIGWGEGGRY